MESKTTKYLELTLSETEAKWLKGIMQNPLFVENLDDESSIDTEMRYRFWKTVEEV